MFQFIKNVFGSSETNYKALIDNGAVIIDVRTPGEFADGNIKGSRNIPINILKTKMAELKKIGKPVITVCASGARSGMAKSLLKMEGIEAYNGGSWSSLNKKI